MKRLLLSIICLLLIVAYGVAEGFWTHRWQPSAALEKATARLNKVPRTVGDWEGTDQELDSRQVARAEMSGHVLRRFVNKQTGAAVTVLLACGRPGPTSLHSPEICYPGAGLNMKGKAVRTPIARRASPAHGDFWVGQFQKADSIAEGVRIYWSWNGAGAWEAADRPRFQFAHHGALYKLYVTRQLALADDTPAAPADDATADFLEQFLPELQRALFAAEPVDGEQGRTKS